jgi:hypothetical protein
MKPKLKPPGIKCSKLKYCIPLSTSAFKFNLRRYMTAQQDAAAEGGADGGGVDADGAEVAAPVDLMAGWSTAGAYTRPLFGST